ncbi:MBL fold metallo-hydrolase [Paenibacillus doosanensis]|uniref:Ribonuclease Z n=1 Tax=Paenibacillus konkukensis TaxID=2020716 RepID=A0ABY4RWT7_9BACL|nr:MULTISPECIES: MBL fold metallo-hydrolase [Paenibacillus]MCS7459366.1 MBL fold metallo-hydrolase [Paenibacillus doosanensis]UQZ87159.1 ribonuclease Z [Paenibacillus konkukensis]
MALQIQMIGTGSAFSKKYYNNNALITVDGSMLLVDCGATAPQALHKLNIPLDRIDAILITHIHADHVGGMEEFAFRLKYAYKKKTRLYVPSAIADSLWNHSLRGGLENLAEGMSGLDDYFDVVLLDEGEASAVFPNLQVELIRTEHIPAKPSYSLFINDMLFYSADCKFDAELLTRLYEHRGCRYIMHDCQLSSPGLVHASLDELLTLPPELQRTVHLMHYDDTMEQFIGKTGEMTFVEQHKWYTFS